ncbi:MAG: PTS glucose transporter subunit IIA [Lachnospiraceae bacterium]
MFNFLKKKQVEEPEIKIAPFTEEPGKEIIGAPISGEAVASVEISDPTFRQEMLGKGIAIKPTVGKVFAPVDGKIEMLIDSLHAVSMTAVHGAEILIHVGLDTVELKGKYFQGYVKEGDMVKRGDLIMEFDIAAITAAGYDMISPVIICNSDDYADIERVTGKQVQVGEAIMKLKK